MEICAMHAQLLVKETSPENPSNGSWVLVLKKVILRKHENKTKQIYVYMKKYDKSATNKQMSKYYSKVPSSYNAPSFCSILSLFVNFLQCKISVACFFVCFGTWHGKASSGSNYYTLLKYTLLEPYCISYNNTEAFLPILKFATALYTPNAFDNDRHNIVYEHPSHTHFLSCYNLCCHHHPNNQYNATFYL